MNYSEQPNVKFRQYEIVGNIFGDVLCGIYQTVNKNLTHMGGCENENTN
jgi:hypothetical protein